MTTAPTRLARFRTALAASLGLLVLAVTVLGALHHHSAHHGTTDTCAVCSLAATTAAVPHGTTVPAPPCGPFARLAPAAFGAPGSFVAAGAHPRAPPTA